MLFDIGEDASFALDSHRIQPPDGKEIGKGFFGSGQTFSVYRFPVVDGLKLTGGPEYTAIENVRGNPGIPLEQHITPAFLGWIGLHWFNGYVLKLDYAHPSVSFYKNESSADRNGPGMQAALKGEKVVQGHPLQQRGSSQRLHRARPAWHPSLSSATLDTGSHNALWLTPELRDQMKADGVLHAEPHGSSQIASVSIDGHPHRSQLPH